ncbi:helix-turn-helix domain-containing protein [Streptomyces sp. WMMC500]|uniref:tetratricopeptide repeat protein n=1 Tax=Streptomyces sp. WMMC500 TaxID=3015154 RepID=UPI00248D2C27|nr:helix-turn-helix domain-containing protein [Streptomyces sp. WMMC500]WBB57755.1 helix-turn-helix domain-containing protein [Streptomyces sp. WMMC500]
MTDRELHFLEHLVAHSGTPAARRLHCRIVLACAAGESNGEVAARFGITAATVCRWRNRFARERLAAVRAAGGGQGAAGQGAGAGREPGESAATGAGGRSQTGARAKPGSKATSKSRPASPIASTPAPGAGSGSGATSRGRSGAGRRPVPGEYVRVNVRLAALMRESGLTPTSLAGQVRELGRRRGLELRCTHTYVKRWLRGSFGPSVPPELIAAVFSRRLGRDITPGDIAAPAGRRRLLPDDLGLSGPSTPHGAVRTAARLWDSDPRYALPPVSAAALRDSVRRWRGATPPAPPQRAVGSYRVGPHDIAKIHALTEHLAMLDNRYGGGAARSIAMTHLRTDVLPMLEGSYTGAVGRNLFRAASLVTHHTAHLLYDTGRHGAARRYLRLALDMAYHGHDRAFAAKILGTLAHQAVHLGDYREAVDLSEAGLAEPGLSPAGRAVLHAMAARAYARLRDSRASAISLSHAESSLSAGSPAQEPVWLRYFSGAELHDEIAHCLVDLRQARAARPHAEHGIAARGDRYARSIAFTRIVLATAWLQQREVEHACQVATGALRATEDIQSERVRGYLAGFRDRLRPFRNVPAAREFSYKAARRLR